MRYIRIKNKGLIEPEALHLVGASTKRNDNTKIGMFGSGNKYALAYFIREGYDLKIFSGTGEISITTKERKFRGHDFNIIHIDGIATSITTEMGKDWHFWQAIREVYCNAIDEGGVAMEFVDDIHPVEGETHFYINTKKDVMEFVGNFDNYFATNKKVLFECEQGRILEKSGTKANIYRKGVRCFEPNKVSVFDYDFKKMNIDENRLAKYFWEVEEAMWDLIYRCTNKDIILQVLHASCNQEFLEGCLSDICTINSSTMSEEFKQVITSSNLAPKSYAGLLKPDERENHIVIPTKVFDSIRGTLKDENVGKAFKTNVRGGFYREVDTTALYDATLKEALRFFEECGFAIPYPIVIALFADKDVGGCADLEQGRIILSDLCLERGVNQTVTVLLEEYIHLKYEVADETRAFQTAMLTEMVSYMKKQNSYAI